MYERSAAYGKPAAYDQTMVFSGFQPPDPSGIPGPGLDPVFGLAAAIAVAIVSVALVRKRHHPD